MTQKKILYLAIADGRGHLMKAVMVKELLPEVRIDILTTSKEGKKFVESFGHTCQVLDRSYKNIYDEVQNLDVEATAKDMTRYVANPNRFGRHLHRLTRRCREYDLVVNDSFNIAALALSMYCPRVVNIYVKNIRRAVLDELKTRPLARAAFKLLSSRAHVSIETTVKPIEGYRQRGKRIILNPLLSMPSEAPPVEDPFSRPEAVVYLNPTIKSADLANLITSSLRKSGYRVHAVGEGVWSDPATTMSWVARDPDLNTRIANADLVVSAPGMGVLSQVMAYRIPFLALCSSHGEQERNLRQVRKSNHIRMVNIADGNWMNQLNMGITALAHGERAESKLNPVEVATVRRELWRSVFADLLK